MATCTWDPSNVASGYTLSNGNLTWTASSTSGDTCGRGTLGYLTGSGVTAAPLKLYFEVSVVAPGTTTFDGFEIGVINAVQSFTTFLGGVGNNSLCAEALSGAIFSADGVGAGGFAGLIGTTGTIYGVYYDNANGKFWATIDGSTFYGNSSSPTGQNPATNSGGFLVPTQVTKPSGSFTTIYPGFGSRQNGPSGTGNFTGPFGHAVAAGFSAWAVSPPVSQFMMGG